MKKEMTAEAYLEKIMTGPIQEDYPVHRTLELLSGKWRTHMIYELCKHPSMRFSELKRAYPHITNTMLTNTLRDLETLGIVNREQFNEIPPHAEYSLTEKGRGLLPVFFEISKWGENIIWTLYGLLRRTIRVQRFRSGRGKRAMTFKEEKLYHLKTCLAGRSGFT